MADPVSLLITIGLNVGFAALQNALADPIQREGPRLNDLKVSTSTYGAPIYELYGSLPVRGNVVWSAGIEEVKNVQKQGGKGGAPKQTLTTYSYYWTGGVSFGKGPMRSLNKLFFDGKLVLDNTSSAGTESRKSGLSIRYYPGSETQEPDSLYELVAGSNLAPAFRGQAVIVFERLALADYGNRIPNITAEFTRYTGSGDPDPAIVTEDSTPIAGGSFDSFSDIFVPDRERNVIYFLDEDGDPQGLRVFDRADMTEIQQGANLISRNIDGTALLAVDLIAITRNGFPVVQFNAGNSRPIATISPDTLDIAGTFGFLTDQAEYNEFTHTNTRIARVTASRTASMQVITPFGVKTFLLMAGDVSDNATLFEVSAAGTLIYVWHGAFSNIPCMTAPEEPGSGLNRFWFFDTPEYSSPDSGDVTLYEMVVPALAGTIVVPPFAIIENNTRPIATLSPSMLTGASNIGALSLVYDPVDGNLIVIASEDGVSGNPAVVTKLDASSGATLWQTNVPFMRGELSGAAWTDVSDGYLVQMNQSDAWAIRTSDGELVREESSISDALAGTSSHYYEGRSGSIVGISSSDSEPYRWYFWRAVRIPALLSDVITDVCVSVGLTASDIDVSALTGVEVDGYAATRQVSARSVLEELSSVYLFDGVESDFQLKFVLRDGKSSSATITESDLANLDDRGNLLANRITQEVELPLVVNLRYLSAARDHQEQSHQSKRVQNPSPTMYSTNPVGVTFSGALDEDVAKRATETLLYSAWSERFGKRALLPWEYLALDPTDVVTVNLDNGDSYRLRLVNVEVGGGLQISVDTVVEDALQFTSVVNADAPTAASNTFLSVPFTKVILLNSPLLRNRDDVNRTYSQLYFLMGGYGGAGWRAGHLYESTDIVNFEHEGVVTTEMAWGTVTSPLPDTRFPNMLNTDDTITVRIRSNRELESITLAELQAEGNAAAIIRAYDDDPEIFQFQTATENGDGTWTLSNLVRGRRGTSSKCANHAAGDVFILLEPGAVGLTDLELSEIGSARYYRGVTEGGVVEETPTITNTSPGNDLKPYPPVSLRSTNGLPGSDMTLEWMRQSRIVVGLVDGDYDPPLAEDSEEYVLQILGGKDGTNELREVTSISSETYTYTSANQTTDFGAGFVDMTSALLTNAGFEEGDLSGWSVDAGAGAVALDGDYGFGDGNISAADEGSRFCVFYFDSASPSAVTISQTFTLADLDDAITSGNAQLRVSAAFASNIADTDTGRIDIVWIDAAGSDISTVTGSEVDPDDGGAWTTQTETVSAGDIPKHAKSCRLEIHGTLNNGSRINVAVDDVTLEFDQGGVPDQISFRVAQVSGQVGTGFYSRGQAISTVADA